MKIYIKLILIIISTLFSYNVYSQFAIYELNNNDKKELNKDSLLLIPITKLDSIVLSQIEIPKSSHKNINKNYVFEGTSGKVYFDFHIIKNKIIEPKKMRGVDQEFDSIIAIQIRKIFDIIVSNIKIDSNKTYSLITGLEYKNDYDKDSIYIDTLYWKHYAVNKSRTNITFKIITLKDEQLPNNINECLVQLDSMFDEQSKQELKEWDEEYFVSEVHHGLGMWLRNNWGLWRGSCLAEYFNNLGISETDDMSAIITKCFHRHISGKDIRFEEQIKYYNDLKEKRIKDWFDKFNIGDTIRYHYNFGFVSRKQEKNFYSRDCKALGIVISKDESKKFLNVKLIESCSKRGILYLDIDKYESLKNNKLSYKKLKKEVIKKMRIGDTNWFYLECWYKN